MKFKWEFYHNKGQSFSLGIPTTILQHIYIAKVPASSMLSLLRNIISFPVCCLATRGQADIMMQMLAPGSGRAGHLGSGLAWTISRHKMDVSE